MSISGAGETFPSLSAMRYKGYSVIGFRVIGFRAILYRDNGKSNGNYSNIISYPKQRSAADVIKRPSASHINTNRTVSNRKKSDSF